MNNEDKKNWLENQIKARLDLLERKEKGELPDLVVPTSLAKCQVWENPDYDINKIGSSSSFVSTHKKHGNRIKKISKLIADLNKKKKSKPTSSSHKIAQLSREKENLEDILTQTSNQFVQYSHECARLQGEVVLLKSIEAGLLEEIEELKAELDQSRSESISLRKKIIQLQGGTGGKIANIDFGLSD